MLRELERVEGIVWIRILYAYPDRISDELLELMAKSEKILPYIDLPLQHANDTILSAMNRRGSRADIEAVLGKNPQNAAARMRPHHLYLRVSRGDA